MECRTTSGSVVREWTRERHSGKGTEKLFINWETAPAETNPLFPQFGIDIDGSGSGFLYCNSTELEDAGIYICSIVQDNSKLVLYSAHLIVLGKFKIMNAQLRNQDCLLAASVTAIYCLITYLVSQLVCRLTNLLT